MKKLIPCKHCPGQAEDTALPCNGEFGSSGCGQWLFGWFCVEDLTCDGCIYMHGRYCLLSVDHCTRRASDYYNKGGS
jgi:hypothetical protein